MEIGQKVTPGARRPGHSMRTCKVSSVSRQPEGHPASLVKDKVESIQPLVQPITELMGCNILTKNYLYEERKVEDPASVLQLNLGRGHSHQASVKVGGCGQSRGSIIQDGKVGY